MREPDFVEWEADGQRFRQVSPQYKRELLIDYAVRFGLRTFVETGTCGGETIETLLPHFDKLYSIELDDRLYALGVSRFPTDATKITLIHGDSAVELPKLLPHITEPALYWLDAHYSGPGTAYGPGNPLMHELEAIMSQKKQGVVLVDDMDFARETSWEHGILRIQLRTA